ncbi:uncharacterized protein LOC110674822 isoform X1 [Aedes aegypti]|uniref:DUF4806 domain-containing protein n=1 Tax=Aedes aegypti TaxID=7159 RepID=A0A6I8U3W2_AEDAE|nr:uncharacterized protein LOC110674821 isoform X1 [Aedes aegypti]XP_021694956.1 uncharacterized protein LOC110674822 isoform X1 [Aedes aegypti]
MTQFVIQSGDGRQYVQMSDGTCLEIIAGEANSYASTSTQIQPTTQSSVILDSSNVITDNDLNNVLDTTGNQNDQPCSIEQPTQEEQMCHDTSIMTVLRDLQGRVTRMETMLEKVFAFMANINRLFETKLSTKMQDGDVKKYDEDFSEFDDLMPVKTEEKLRELEHQLKTQSYADKLYRFFETVFKLNGKREGKPFFRNLLRKFVDPSILVSYSWLGNSRAKKGEPANKNKSFKDNFPSFVQFVGRIQRSADFEFSAEDTEESFSQFLRQKNTELKRKIARSGAPKASHTKKRRQHSQHLSPRIDETTEEIENEDLSEQIAIKEVDIIPAASYSSSSSSSSSDTDVE